MKKICAWCKKEIEEITDPNTSTNFEITHGICRSCKDYFFNNRATKMDKFLNQLDAPVLMVNPQGEVLLANNQALQFLDKDLAVVKDLRVGDVMECAYARLPGGCGGTRHCIACTIRNSIKLTHETGKSLNHVPAFLNHLDGQTAQSFEYLISTEKVAEVVLLRIDEVIDKSSALKTETVSKLKEYKAHS